MSVNRIFHWVCDICSHVEFKKDYGLPDGYVYCFSKDGIKHACKDCVKHLKDNKIDYYNAKGLVK